jgi:S-adenosylmethionine hydrolase
VGPDNGLFTYIYDREPSHQTFHVTAEKYFRPSPSTTFHGRDIFAPVAAALSKGVKPEAFGPSIADELRLATSPTPTIIHIDHFGNCITNITRDLFDSSKQPTLLVKRKVIDTFVDFYGAAPPNTLVAIWGSAGFLEISVNRKSAAKILGAKRGDPIILRAETKLKENILRPLCASLWPALLHVVALSRAHLEFASLAFFVLRFHPDFEGVHAAVVYLAFS